MTVRTGSIVKTCPCGTEFRISPCHQAAGKGKFCSPPCAMAGRRVNFVKGSTTSITPKALARLAPVDDDKGGSVICARCGRERQRGVRCVCERRTPDGE